jgi:type II secretory pathway component PulJ
MMARLHNQSGFTVAEVLAATALSLVTLATVLSFNRFQLFALRNQANQIDVQMTARSIVDLFAREVRRTGMNPGCAIAGFSGIVSASPYSLRIQSDLNGDGVINGTNEDLTYRYNSDRNSIQRVDNISGAADVLASGIDFGNSKLRYFDGTGAEMVPGGTGLTAAQRSAVRRIRIQLALSEKAVDPNNATSLTAQAATDVDLRNRFFVNSTACPGS